MYKELRPVLFEQSATNPKLWAENFRQSGALGSLQQLRFRFDHRFGLIRRHVPPNGRILDAGSGAGEWVAFLNSAGYQAEGVDYSEELIGRTRQMYPQHRWMTGTVQALPYDDETFDAVISWGVIEHDEEGPDRALREFRRVLKPGGVAIVTVPVDTERQRRASRAGFPPTVGGNRNFFQYFMSTDELADHLRRSDFKVIAQGLQRSAALWLLSPRLAARVSLATRNALNKVVRLAFWWHPGAMNMTYCIGRKSA